MYNYQKNGAVKISYMVLNLNLLLGSYSNLSEGQLNSNGLYLHWEALILLLAWLSSYSNYIRKNHVHTFKFKILESTNLRFMFFSPCSRQGMFSILGIFQSTLLAEWLHGMLTIFHVFSPSPPLPPSFLPPLPSSPSLPPSFPLSLPPSLRLQYTSKVHSTLIQMSGFSQTCYCVLLYLKQWRLYSFPESITTAYFEHSWHTAVYPIAISHHSHHHTITISYNTKLTFPIELQIATMCMT